jgi:hypothetical protein
VSPWRENAARCALRDGPLRIFHLVDNKRNIFD